MKGNKVASENSQGAIIPIEEFESALLFISYSDRETPLDFANFLNQWQSDAFSTLRNEFVARIKNIDSREAPDTVKGRLHRIALKRLIFQVGKIAEIQNFSSNGLSSPIIELMDKYRNYYEKVMRKRSQN